MHYVGLITRPIMDNVPTLVATFFYITSFVVCTISLGFIARRFWQYRQAKGSRPAPMAWLKSGRLFLKELFFHPKILQNRYAGIAHLLTFYGFTLLFIGTCLVFLEHETPLHFFYGRFYLIASLVIDLGGLAFLIGLGMFAWRRRPGTRKGRVKNPPMTTMRWLLLAIGVSGFLLEASRIAVVMPPFERWSIVGYSIAWLMQLVQLKGDIALALHRSLWIAHAILCIAFFGLLPWRFFSHMIYATVLGFVQSDKPAGQLRPSLPNKKIGVTTWQDFNWRDLLEVDACTTCGRCNKICPAHAAGKPLMPRQVLQNIRQTINTPLPLMSLIKQDAIWSCTTCGACNDKCPLGIEIFDKIIELRRGCVELEQAPNAVREVLKNIATHASPFAPTTNNSDNNSTQHNHIAKDEPNNNISNSNINNVSRMDWARWLSVPIATNNEPIELLYWIGCSGTFDPAGQTTSRAMVKILNHLGIKYHVLGNQERCTGDPAQRLGDQGLFAQLAKTNIQVMQKHQVTKILTHCPHCFNSLMREYPAYGGHFEVEHHSVFLQKMIQTGQLKFPNDEPLKAAAPQQKITFHDPCYLARFNDTITEPRDVLFSLPQAKPVEMPRHEKQTACCGAGGGAMWIPIKSKKHSEQLRVLEAAKTGATTIATACPFCKHQLQIGSQAIEKKEPAMMIRDLAELVVEATGL